MFYCMFYFTCDLSFTSRNKQPTSVQHKSLIISARMYYDRSCLFVGWFVRLFVHSLTYGHCQK